MAAQGILVTSRANPRVKQLRAAVAGDARLASGLVALEGEHLLEEAVRSGQAIKTVFVLERRSVPAWVPGGVEVIRLPVDIFASCTETAAPQGLAALMVPPVSTVESMLTGTPLLLVAVGLQDPGNLGTLVRSAQAFGATGVLLTAGTVSAWNGKAMRASAGAVFHVPLAASSADGMRALQARGVRVLAAVKEDATPAHEAALCGPVALLVGNEGAGLDGEWLGLADGRVTVPCPGAVESLNAAVAGSLLLYEASRQRAGQV